MIDWNLFNDSRVLVAANGSFLLNGAAFESGTSSAGRSGPWNGSERSP